MRVDFRIHDLEPAAEALRALPQRERSNALRLLLRKHFGELPGLICFQTAPQQPERTDAEALSTQSAPVSPSEPEPAAGTSSDAGGKLAGLIAKMKERGSSSAILAGFMLLGGLAFLPAARAEAATWHIDANLASYHTQRWARESLNQRNPGVGLEYQATRTWTLASGAYTNSYSRPTVYALAEFTPLHLGQADHWHLDAGIAGGFASGYTRDEIPCSPFVGAALLRIVAPGGTGLNIVGVPNMGRYRSGFIGLQLSFPLH